MTQLFTESVSIHSHDIDF